MSRVGSVAVYVMVAMSLFASCSRLNRAADEAQSAAPYQYRHANATCRDCHRTEKSDPARIAAAPVDQSACLDCHNYRENHHPIDIIPDNRGVSGFPLFNGKLSCLTCHEMHGGPSHHEVAKLLRGGPYRERRSICFNCHPFPEQPFNPHQMLDATGQPASYNGKSVCLICHSKQPDPVWDQSEDVKLRADVAFLCWRCHPPMPGPFLGQHFLVQPSLEQRMYLKKKEEDLGVKLPLVPRGRITCSTCHNPHQAGVIKRSETAKGADYRHWLRDPQLCTICHNN